jgi:ABC-type glycerol-3-phosphate transport system substrate-binding protein
VKTKWKWAWAAIGLLATILLLSAVVALTFRETAAEAAIEYKAEDARISEDGLKLQAEDGVREATGEAGLLEEWKGRKQVLEWKEGASATWEADIPEDGRYELTIGYYPLEGNGRSVEFLLFIDGVPVSEDDVPFQLNRAWRDEPGPLKRSNGNDLRPKQIEAGVWLESKIIDQKDMLGTPLALDLKKGRHSFRMDNIRESAVLEYLIFSKPAEPVTYEQYRESLPDAAKQRASGEIAATVQAESAYMKSDSGLFPTIDRSSPLTAPYHPTKIRINTIGASNWEIAGQWISWKLEVPEDGLYKIGLRYRQNDLKGAFVTRKIYLDGEVPFRELNAVKFDYQSGWGIKEIGEETGDPYLFYLTKGVHELKLEVTLGEMAAFINEVQEIVYELNEQYRKIIMITGVRPDPYRDYEIQDSIPGLIPAFESLQDRMNARSAKLESMAKHQNQGSRALLQLAEQLESFVDRPDKIPKRLESYINNVTVLADWIISSRYQPLELDYLYAAGAEAERAQAEAGFFQKGIHEIRAFSGSFFEDYDSLGAETQANSESINVWIGSGRDQAYVIKRLVDESFTPQTGIHVNVNLVRNALVVGVMAGKGPDINLFTRRGEAMDLAFRGALSPLDSFEGFEELKEQYFHSAFEPYAYEGHTYAIPDEQEFFMMYYRKDILNELGLKPPQTWEELMQIAPILQNRNLQVGLPYENLDANQLKDRGIGTLNLFPTLLMQSGVNLYTDNHHATRLDEPKAYEAFKQWTDFYKLYDYPLYKSDFFRFRTGEMPITIASYKLYNLLSVAAPEIAGNWSMMQIPGVRQPDGFINRTSASTGTSAIMLKNAKDPEAAWAFIKWWNSPEIQSQFARELENETGVVGRKTPANLAAFDRSNWSAAEQSLLLEQWKVVQEIPELPGSYYTTRSIDNAFRSVIFQWENPRESLNFWNKQINEEIKRKRFEFGVEE